MAERKLLKNVHSKLLEPNSKLETVKGSYDYFHYRCDGVNDAGWGCGYRTLQTICSWLQYQNKPNNKTTGIPTISQIQKALVEMQDKKPNFLNSREWIGSFEVCICLDYFYDVSCRIVHVKAGRKNLFEQFEGLREHFSRYGSPVMMGGDKDASSKCVLGVRGEKESNCELLILDPHCQDRLLMEEDLVTQGWVSWRDLSFFLDSSFYNLCLPIHKFSE